MFCSCDIGCKTISFFSLGHTYFTQSSFTSTQGRCPLIFMDLQLHPMLCPKDGPLIGVKTIDGLGYSYPYLHDKVCVPWCRFFTCNFCSHFNCCVKHNIFKRSGHGCWTSTYLHVLGLCGYLCVHQFDVSFVGTLFALRRHQVVGFPVGAMDS